MQGIQATFRWFDIRVAGVCKGSEWYLQVAAPRSDRREHLRRRCTPVASTVTAAMEALPSAVRLCHRVSRNTLVTLLHLEQQTWPILRCHLVFLATLF
jgi:hypothetical protein